MGNTNNISLSGLFKAFRRVISPTAEADLGFMRHPELGSAEDEALWKSDMDYLKNLTYEIYDELDDGGFLWEMPFPVEGVLFWNQLGPEPTDEAAIMLADWRFERRAA